jgi:flagellar biosynthesis/type III secretory pathway protein FliH
MSSDRPDVPGADNHTEPFLYLPTGDEVNASAGGNGAPLVWDPQGPLGRANINQRERVVFDRGIQEGETRVRVGFEQQLLALRTSVTAALENFKLERAAYFSRIEPEVVQLALAIARKILHREAQMDPLLLTGMVHVALEKLDAGTRVRLRAHPSEIHFWNEYFSQSGSFQPSPELVGDPALEHGDCALETEIGSTQISLDTQLKEIEQGFFDLLDQRPRVR